MLNMNCRGCGQSILVPRARRLFVTWSGNDGLPLVGYKLSRVALGTKMVGRGSSLYPTWEDRRRLCSQGIGLSLCHQCTTFFIQFLDALLRIPPGLIFDKSRQLEL